MLGSTYTCTATDRLPVKDNWNAAAIFDSLILTPPSGQAIYSVHAAFMVITQETLGSKLNRRLQFTIYAYYLPCDCPMTSHFNLYRFDIQTLFRIAN